MASGAFSPKTALLLTPLVSSTCTLVFAFDQHTFYSLFTNPKLVHHKPASSNDILPPYLDRFFIPGITQVVAFLGVTTWTTVGCIYSSRSLLSGKGSLPWYVGAAALAVGHLLFIPAVAPPMKSVMDNEGGGYEFGDAKEDSDSKKEKKKKSNVDYMNEWLRVNMVRTLTTDLGAWVCAVIAVTKTFSE